MKTRVIHVPRSLVKYHMPHPEAYGESIVVLENDMTTDVYTFDDGKLYTETNNKGLINFLLKANSDDKKTVIEQDYLSLVSISLDDVHQLKTWFQKSAFRQFQLIDNCEEIIKLYISHAKTINSDVFMIKIDDHDIGIIGFSIIDHVAILSCELYEYKLRLDLKIELMINSIRSYILNRYEVKNIIFPVFEYELRLLDIVRRVGFIKSNRAKIKIPTLSGYLHQIEFEFPML